MGTTLTAPFPEQPYFGSKRRMAPQIWARLGNPDVYVEPFAGSLACLLARPGGAGPREIVSDLDGGISNFWRAVSADPDEVARWADWPTIHQDLTARHAWLRGWIVENADRLSIDPEFYSAKAAGWWVWGMSLWIGGGWCHTGADLRPHVQADGGGRGVTAQRDQIPHAAQRVGDKRPHVKVQGSGPGVSAQRLSLEDKRPHAHDTPGGRGVSAQRVSLADQRPYVADRPSGQGVSAQRARVELLRWFSAIQERMAAVVVLNRGWESALTPTLLQQVASRSGRRRSVGVLLDPPYSTAERAATIYGSDLDGDSDSVAAAAWGWAVENGDQMRVAYCCHEGDIVVPEGWESITGSLQGIRDPERRDRRDQIVFSPACQAEAQGRLL